ncbi:carbohydrate kinase [Hymenobacter sp. BT730]|uniref:carbohydrate kinase family protein n=1 Tax=Hymenobacter sp. BT730 TaxID=3063332 RepID=UPI0026DF8E9E|nr:carbohydrate kinase [Hymenobacter sp. BT730]
MLTPLPIVCFGEMLWDMLPAGKQPGGAPFNVAVHLHQLGVPVQLISRVGDDELGAELLAFSASKGLDNHLVQRSATHLTSVVKANVSQRHEVTFKILKPVAWDYIQHTDELRAAVAASGGLVYGSLAARSLTTRETLYRLLQVAPFKVFDVNLRPPHYSREVVKYLLRQADLVKLNEPELTEIMSWLGQPAADLATALPWLAGRFGLQAVCVTRGAAGAALWTDNQLFNCPGFPVPVQDTIGCGDALLAALLAGRLAGLPPATYLRRACAAGALVAMHQGAMPPLTPADIDVLASSTLT